MSRDPALWWLNYELPPHRFDTVISMTKVQDYWIMVSDRAVWKLSVDYDGNPLVQILQEL